MALILSMATSKPWSFSEAQPLKTVPCKHFICIIQPYFLWWYQMRIEIIVIKDNAFHFPPLYICSISSSLQELFLWTITVLGGEGSWIHRKGLAPTTQHRAICYCPPNTDVTPCGSPLLPALGSDVSWRISRSASSPSHVSLKILLSSKAAWEIPSLIGGPIDTRE